MEVSWSSVGHSENSSFLVIVPNDTRVPGGQSENEAYPLYLRAWVSVASGIIFVVGVGGNAIVPILIWKNKELRHSTNIFLLNLALADILVLLICLPTALVELHSPPNSWILGPILCRLVPYVEISVSRASVFTLTVISVERYVAICRPLQSASLCTRPRATVVCLTIWPLSLLAAYPVLAVTEYVENHETYNATLCLTSINDTLIAEFYIVSTGIFYCLPFCLLTTIYYCIARKLLHGKTWSRGRSDNAQRKGRKQVAAMLGIVVLVFFICLLPFHAFVIWIIATPDKIFREVDPKTFYNALYFCRIMTFINSAANPIIYNVMSSKFRSALIKLFSLSNKSGNRLLRRRSTLTTSTWSSTSGHSKPMSLGKRASIALGRRFSNVAGRRGSERSITSTSSLPTRKGSCSSSRKEGDSCGHISAEEQDELASPTGENENGSYFSSWPREDGESSALVLYPMDRSGVVRHKEVSNNLNYKLTDAIEVDEGNPCLPKATLHSSPQNNSPPNKKVSFKESSILHHDDPHCPVAPPRKKRQSSSNIIQASVNGKSKGNISIDSVETKDKLNDSEYTRGCRCNSKSITRCSFRKSTQIEDDARA